MLRSFASGTVFGAATGDEAPWLLALHGWRRTLADFARVLAGPPVLDALALDLPGFGASPLPPSPWGSADYAAAIAPVLEEMAAQRGGPVVVLGHSFGGRVALQLAERFSELVAALVLTGVPLLPPAGGAPRPARGYRLARWAHRRGLLSDERFEAKRLQYGSEDLRGTPAALRPTFVRLVNERYDGQFRQLRLPVVLVWGALDDVVPLEVAERAAGLLPDARLECCAGVGHMLPLERPDALRAAVLGLRP